MALSPNDPVSGVQINVSVSETISRLQHLQNRHLSDLLQAQRWPILQQCAGPYSPGLGPAALGSGQYYVSGVNTM